MSPIVTAGKSVPQSKPGLSSRSDRGPVEPMQPPSTLAQMTKKRSVSTGRPGPTTRSHQPSLPVSGCGSATYWSQRQRMADQHRVRARRVQRAVGAIRHRQTRQGGAAFQHDPVVERDVGMRDPGERCRLVHRADCIGRRQVPATSWQRSTDRSDHRRLATERPFAARRRMTLSVPTLSGQNDVELRPYRSCPARDLGNRGTIATRRLAQRARQRPCRAARRAR